MYPVQAADGRAATRWQIEAWPDESWRARPTHQFPPGVDQGSEGRFGCPFLETSVLVQMDEGIRCAEGTYPPDPFCNHTVVNSDAGVFLKGTSPPFYPSLLDTHGWLGLPTLQSLHLTLGVSTPGPAPGPLLGLSLGVGADNWQHRSH